MDPRRLARHAVTPLLLVLLTTTSAEGENRRPVACGDTLGPGGSYILDNDLHCETPINSVAITLLSGARLDLRGHTFSCSFPRSTTAIRLEGRRTRVENGEIVGCGTAVQVAGEGQHLVRNLRATNDEATQCILVESARNQIRDNAVTGCDVAYFIGGSKNVLHENYSIETNGVGFFITGSDNRLHRNVATGSVCEGFLLKGTGNLLRRSVASRGVLAVCAGIEVDGTDNEIRQSIVTANPGVGIEVRRGSGHRVIDNWSNENGTAGIQVTSTAQRIEVLDNTARNNGTFDLQDDNPGCDDNTWTGNVFGNRNAMCIN